MKYNFLKGLTNIKDVCKKEKKKWIYIVLLIVLGSFFFYWFQIRPANIRRFCLYQSTKDSKNLVVIDTSYKVCIIKKGLEPEPLFEEKPTEINTQEVDTSDLENSISDLQYQLEDTMKEQNRFIQEEFQNKANCESNGGRYQGNGLCSYY